MPDFDLRPSASFISSKDGDTPPSESRRLIKTSSSYCFFVSMGTVLTRTVIGRNKTKTQECSSLVRQTRQAPRATNSAGAGVAGERHDLDAVPRLCCRRQRRAHDQAIRPRQQRHHRAVLLAEGAHLERAVGCPGQRGAQVVLAPI